MNTVQAYLRELRIGRKISQEELADAIGLSRRAYLDWESGKTEGIKDTPLFRAIDMLKAGLHHIHYLATHPETPIEQAVLIAKAWLKGNDILDTEVQEFVANIKQSGKVAEALDIIQQLEELDPLSLERLLGYGQSLLDRNR